MKSSYELAMERMGGDHTQKVLSESQKEKIAEITSKYDAKIAEKKIFLEKISKRKPNGEIRTRQIKLDPNLFQKLHL